MSSLTRFLFNESLLTDDPYIIGWAAACLVVPGFLVYYIFEEFKFKNIHGNKALCWYSLLPFTYFFSVYLYGGEGSGYAAFFTIIYIVALTISFLALKHLEKKMVRNLSWCLGLIWGLGYMSWFLRH
jgi:hypothetical protein